MIFKKLFLIQCIIALIVFPVISFCGSIQKGFWSTPSGDVSFYIIQQSQLDTLRVKFTFSGNCSSSMERMSTRVSIMDMSFSLNLESPFNDDTGMIIGTFSENGTSCSGTYSYNKFPCDSIKVTWTATPSMGIDTLKSDTVNIVDVNFLNALIGKGVDTNGDGVISYTEAEVIDSIDVTGLEISDMTGIEAFINLKSLKCRDNQLTSLDMSGNPLIGLLWCASNQLTNLNVTNNTALKDLWCSNNQLTSLDLLAIPPYLNYGAILTN